ncbi:hypothetical protein [Leucobacter iarius]|uniref:hypothetical protein n=1 Tax=Leucobacter iarius TaxID=333963 RepID=UPI0031D892E2
MPSSPAVHPRSRGGWAVLTGLLLIEAFFGIVVVFFSILGAMNSAGTLGQNLSLVLAAAISWIWVVVTLVGALRGRPSWARGSALTIHVLLFAAGTGILQLQLLAWQFGFAIVAVGVVGFVAAMLARPADRPTLEGEED